MPTATHLDYCGLADVVTREISPEIEALDEMARRQLRAEQLQRIFAQRTAETRLGRVSTPERKASRAKQKAATQAKKRRRKNR
ncbi:hypothetical protein VXE65_32645 [Mycolicibacterium conceptionense]|uniref:hypothetical protein n=1 Tax=Mycolicibacterium conceptionense TaxID=451644 RepID=UPI003204DA05